MEDDKSTNSPELDATIEKLHAASKEYLEAIYELNEESQVVLQARISKRLALSPPTVSEGIKRLIADGYVSITEGHVVELTPQGHAVAEVLVRRHRLAERMLTDILGIPWHLCHKQAENWEKVMTTEVEQAIIARLGDQQSCPHGNPIPGSASIIPWTDLTSVAAMTPGDFGRIVRLLEDIELDDQMMKYLEVHCLMPGFGVSVSEVSPDGVFTLDVEGQQVPVSPQLAQRVWVMAGQKPAAVT